MCPGGVTLVAAPTSAAAPYFGIRWGSLAKSVADTSPAPVTGVRAGRHACYDRIVLDVGGVRARLPFRVFVLDGPGSGSRLVVDVAHRW